MRNKPVRFAPALLSFLSFVLLFPVYSFADSLTGAEILEQFNLVTLGSTVSTSHVDGRSYIGGSVSGGEYNGHVNDTPASDYAGLTVAGSAAGVKVNGLGTVVKGDMTASTVNSGSSVVLGTASSTTFNQPAYVAVDGGSNNFNGGIDSSLATGTSATAADSTDFGAVLSALSSNLKALDDTSTYTISGNRVTFHATANSDGLAVFDLSNSAIFAISNLEFDFVLDPDVEGILFNVGLADPSATTSLRANFLGGSAANLGDMMLWNFYNATSLEVAAQWGGSILSVGASLTMNQNVEGGVYVASLAQYGEIHLQPYTGPLPSSSSPVPEPTTLVLFGAGLSGLAALRNRSRKQSKKVAASR